MVLGAFIVAGVVATGQTVALLIVALKLAPGVRIVSPPKAAAPKTEAAEHPEPLRRAS